MASVETVTVTFVALARLRELLEDRAARARVPADNDQDAALRTAALDELIAIGDALGIELRRSPGG